MEVGASLSPCEKYRYHLYRIWNRTQPALTWVMLNPSTADANIDDATIRRCMGFALNAGFGGIEVYNLFALRSTYPGNLLKNTDPVGPENNSYLERISKTNTVIAAWGIIPQGLAKREFEVLQMLIDRDWKCLGLTLEGFPRHPVRLPYKTEFEKLPLIEVAQRLSRGAA